MNKIEEIESRKNLELNKQDKFILQLHQELIRERQIINNKNEEIDRLKQLYETDKESWKEQMFELQQKIDKAIEYIKENCYDYDYETYSSLTTNEVIELLEILKGKGK